MCMQWSNLIQEGIECPVVRRSYYPLQMIEHFLVGVGCCSDAICHAWSCIRVTLYDDACVLHGLWPQDLFWHVLWLDELMEFCWLYYITQCVHTPLKVNSIMD